MPSTLTAADALLLLSYEERTLTLLTELGQEALRRAGRAGASKVAATLEVHYDIFFEEGLLESEKKGKSTWYWLTEFGHEMKVLLQDAQEGERITIEMDDLLGEWNH